MKSNKKLVFWGVGNICKLCRYYYPNIKPSFYIDSNFPNSTFEGLSIKKPEEVSEWNDLFIVIVNMGYSEIEMFLKKKNLKEKSDFLNYCKFFCEKQSIEESIKFTNEFFKQNMDYLQSTFIFALIFPSRQHEIMVNFWEKYVLSHQPEKCVMFTHLRVIPPKVMEERIGAPLFNIPDICEWNGEYVADSDDVAEILNDDFDLSEDEKEWIFQLEDIKTSINKEESIQIVKGIYCYFKKIVEIVKPKNMILWGGWSRESYILAHIAEIKKIPFGFMEYGWLPGTLQFDKGGIAGQSEYAVNPNSIFNIKLTNKTANVLEIKRYITQNKLDTSKFRFSFDDERNIKKIDRNRKTIFFPGMDDVGMGINPASDYWKNNISSIVSSSLEVVELILNICKNNQWNFIFKPHPRTDTNNRYAHIIADDDVIFVRDMEIDRLIDLADVVVSIASAVDYKVLLYDKPLVQLGHTTLKNKGCSYEVYKKEEIEFQIKNAILNGMTEKQKQNYELHLRQILEKYLWDDLSEKKISYGLPVEKDFFDVD